METTVTTKEKIMAVLAYVPFPPLFLVPLLAGRNDSFIEFHGKQGLVIFLVWFALWILSLFPFVVVIAYIGFFALLVAAVVAIVRAWTGNRWEIPILGRWAKKLKL